MIFTLEEFERLIPDAGIRKYLSGAADEDSFLDNLIEYVPLYQKIFNLAFVYAFSCYLDLKNNSLDGKTANLEECIKKGNSNSQRVIRTMQNIYTRYPLSSELMQFVLADIHYDFIQGENACLKRYFPNCVCAGDYWCDKGVGLNDYFAFVNENAESSRTDRDPLGDAFNLESAGRHLRNLIGFFPFLGTTALRYDEQAGWYVFAIQNYAGKIFRGGVVDTFGLVQKCSMSGSQFCFLSAIEQDALKYETSRMDKFVTCPMVGVDGEGSFSKKGASLLKSPYHIPTDYETIISYFGPTAADLTEEITPGATMDQLFNINYKYIKNLALSIADVIGKRHYSKAGERLRKVFGVKYPHAFENYTEGDKNWDSIVVILLIEAGPSMVLREVFYALDDTGDEEILRNLHRRFGSMLKGTVADLDSSEEFTARAMERLGKYYVRHADNEELERYNCELMAKAKAQIVLSAMVEVEEKDSLSRADCFHTDTVKQYIVQLEAARESEDKEQQCELVEHLLGDTLRRLICFYHGIFAYGEKKIEFENASRKAILKPDEITKHQRAAEKAFSIAVDNTVRDLREVSSAVELLHRFVEMCDACCRTEVSVEQQRSQQSRWLYAVLGKNHIMNRVAFDRIVDVRTVSAISTQNIDWWMDVAISLLHFFSTGSSGGQVAGPGAYHAIAPMVASYNDRRNRRDGYQTVSFTLIFDANEFDGKSVEISMLSEFAYENSTRYYCLPNIVRSNSKWWIDPFVIECFEFDKYFFEG